jgi:CHAT domain-containing protein
MKCLALVIAFALEASATMPSSATDTNRAEIGAKLRAVARQAASDPAAALSQWVLLGADLNDKPELADLAAFCAVRRVRCRAALGQWADAGSDFSTALQHYRAQPNVLSCIELARAAMLVADFDRGRLALDLALQHVGTLPTHAWIIWQSEGDYLELTGKYHAATAAYTRALETCDSAEAKAAITTSLGLAQFRSGALIESQATMAQAEAQLLLDPKNEALPLALLRVNQAAIALELGQVEAALSTVRRALPQIQSTPSDKSSQALGAWITCGAVLHLAVKSRPELAAESVAMLENTHRQSLALPSHHPQRLQAANNLWCYLHDRQDGKANVIAAEAASAALTVLDQLPLAASEAERLSLQRRADALTPLMAMRPLNPGLIAQAAIASCGAVLDAVLEQNRVAKLGTPAEQAQYLSHRQRAAASTSASEAPDHGEELRRASQALGLADKVPARPPVAVITTALPVNTALVIYASYREYQGWGSFDRHRLLAVVLLPDQDPKVIPLPRISSIQRHLRKLDDAVTSTDNASATTALTALRKELWDPIQTQLPRATDQLYLCADGPVAPVPFVAWIESPLTSITYLATPRALLHQDHGSDLKGTWIAVDGGLREAIDLPKNLPFPFDLISTVGQLSATPGTRAEIASIQALTPKWLPAITTESAMRDVITGNPSVIHIASHAINATSDTQAFASSAEWEGSDLPLALWRSALVFPGLVENLQKPTDPDADDCVFAAELALLPLSATELVTLSTCNSGLGLIASGEGNYSLARACHSAGARDVLVSMARLRDDAGQSFMQCFYSQVIAGVDPAKAAWQSQRQLWTESLAQQGLCTALDRFGRIRLIRSRGVASNPTQP